MGILLDVEKSGMFILEGDILGGSTVGVFTLGGGDEEVQRRLISMTSSFTEVIK